jgi:hypothetical protein
MKGVARSFIDIVSFGDILISFFEAVIAKLFPELTLWLGTILNVAFIRFFRERIWTKLNLFESAEN